MYRLCSIFFNNMMIDKQIVRRHKLFRKTLQDFQY